MLGRPPYKLEELEDYQELVKSVVEHPKRYAWWIYVDGEFAGLVATFEIHAEPDNHGLNRCFLYYVVKTNFQNQGVATAAVNRAVDYLLTDVNLDAVEVKILMRNKASLHLAMKLGFGYRESNSDEYEENGQKLEVWHGIRYKSRLTG